MELHSNTQCARATASTVIQRPPISRIARPGAREYSRESFPGKLIIPNIQTQLDVPTVNVTPPPSLYTHSHDTSTYIDDHDTDGLGRLDSHVYTPAYHLRQLSVSSYASQYSVRTQSTLQAIPTLTVSTAKQHQRRKTSFASSRGRGVRTSTPIQFFKRSLRRSYTPGGDNQDNIDTDEYQLESQVTGPLSGFQYAATPSIGTTVSSRDPDLVVPLSVRCMQPSPVSTSGEKHCMSIRVVEGIKFFEGLAKRFKIFFRAGRNVGGWKISMRLKGSKRENLQTEIGGVDLYTDRGKVKATPTFQAKHCQKMGSHGIFSWGPGAKTLRIKNNGAGGCVFIVYVYVVCLS